MATSFSLRFAAAIFDMDGLLFDTEPLYFDIGVQIARAHGREFTRWHMDQMIGVRAHDAHQWMIAELELPVTIDELNRRSRELFQQRIAEHLPVIAPAVACLRKLRELGLPTAVATSTALPTVERMLGAADIRQLFDAVATGPEVENSKPAPDVYLLAAARLEVPPEYCVAFEDSQTGVAAAKAAGMTCVAVPAEFTTAHDFRHADLRVSSLTDPQLNEFLGLDTFYGPAHG